MLINIKFWVLPAAGLSAHTAQALATGPVSATIPNTTHEPHFKIKAFCLKIINEFRMTDKPQRAPNYRGPLFWGS